MKVLSLQCDQGHGFEGWFSSEADYLQQCERGLLTCPLCASVGVQRLPSAPRLNLSNPRPPQAPESESKPAPVACHTPESPNAQALWLQAVRHALASTEDVGERFVEEARRIHYGESEQRGIRGQASAEEAESLRDEGIEVTRLILPPVLKEPLQ
ncbi:MAG: hypothetical protein RLZZ598_438 [Pseudomonadota bacterium]|jgi:hypothetical protein